MSRRPWRNAIAGFLVGITVAAVAITPIQLVVSAAPADAANGADFNPGFIISDRYFYDANALSAAEIQSFLDAKIGGCSNGACLNVLTANFPGSGRSVASTTGDLICDAIPAESVSAALFIYQVQQACSISARVILVTLQKEEALVSGAAAQAPSQGRLDIAMGYACPDTAACDTRYYGVANQVYWGAWQFKAYSAGKFFRQPGWNYIGYSPNANCGGTTLLIQNDATAALYNYTPYQPNAAALANLYGSGDACSAYGNRNFWRIYSDWFGSPTGNPPIGWMDTATVVGGTVVTKGWSIDTDVPTGAVPVRLRVDGVEVGSAYANQNRPGLGAAVLPAAGDNHGFTMSGPVSPGTHTVCVIGLDSDGAAPATLLHLGSDASNNCASITVSAPPVGWLDSVTILGANVSASGWTIDPDTAAPVGVKLTVDGAVGATGTANTRRPGLAAAIGSSAGDDHGYTLSATIPLGTHTICVVASNDAPGPDTTLSYGGAGGSGNCAVVNYPGPRSPMGWMDSATLQGSTVTASGWSIDPDTAAPVRVQLMVDGSIAATGVASTTRPGLAAAVLPAAGDDHGYTLSAALSLGTHTVCVVALDDAGGASTRLLYGGVGASGNCAIIRLVGSTPPVGWLDSAALLGSTVWASGWAIDPDTSAAIQVQLMVDGVVAATGTASTTRPGLAAAIGSTAGDNHGYTISAPVSAGTHTVCVVALNNAFGLNFTLLYGGPGAKANCASVTYSGPRSPIGWMDSATVQGSTLTASGWSIDPDTSSAVTVQLTVDGAVAATTTANLHRPGLAAAVLPPAGDDHGYSLSTMITAGWHSVCVVALDDAGGASARLAYGGPNAFANCAAVKG